MMYSIKIQNGLYVVVYNGRHFRNATLADAIILLEDLKENGLPNR